MEAESEKESKKIRQITAGLDEKGLLWRLFSFTVKGALEREGGVDGGAEWKKTKAYGS